MSRQTLKNLPPHVLRELKRHVSPTPLKGVPKGGNNSTSNNNTGLYTVLAGCVALTATAASFPVVATWWISHLNAREDALTGPQVRRGAFLNSGSKDVGRDPEWDFATGTSQHASGYAVINKEGLPDAYQAMDDRNMEKHAQEIEDFAKGRRNPRREARLKEKGVTE